MPPDDDLRLRALAELELEAEAQGSPSLPAAPVSPDLALFQQAQASQPDSRNYLEQFSSSLYNDPGGTAKKTAAIALPVAGAMLAPELLPLAGLGGEAEAGVGALRTLFHYLTTGGASAVGDAAGQQVAESTGLTQPTSLGEKAVRLVGNTTLGTAAGYGGDVIGRGAGNRFNNLDYPGAALNDPQIQAAQRWGERSGMEHDPLRRVVAAANTQASDDFTGMGLNNSLAAELGANAGETANEIKLGDSIIESMPQLRQSGVLQGPRNPRELLAAAQAQEAQVNATREAALTEHGHLPIDPAHMQQTWNELDQQVARLRAIEGSNWEELQAAVNRRRNDFAGQGGQGITVRDAAEQNQTLNLIRQQQREFNSGNYAADVKGDVTQARVQADEEAIPAYQAGLRRAIDATTGSTVLSDLNAQQGALRDLQQQATKFQRGIQQGDAVKPQSRMIQNARQATAGPAAFNPDIITNAATGNAHGVVRSMLGRLFGQAPPVSDALLRTEANQTMGTNALGNINDLMSLNANPAVLPFSQVGPVASRAGQAAIAAPQLFGAQEAQAQAQTPQPLPRDSAALTAQPEALFARVAQLSNNNTVLLQDVASILHETNELKKEQAFAELAKQIPGLFTAGPFVSEFNGKILDMEERGLFAEQLRQRQRAGEISSTYLAQQTSALNADGRLIEPPAAPPVLTGGQKLSSMLGSQRQYAY